MRDINQFHHHRGGGGLVQDREEGSRFEQLASRGLIEHLHDFPPANIFRGTHEGNACAR